MAGLIQVGDIIKFSEVAWTVWNYGWAAENNAGETYRAFGAEVYSLRGSLERLDEAVKDTQASLSRHGARDTDILGGDRKSLKEIIGDYEATLDECYQLLARNRRYSQTTGPARNIEWNIGIMPQVEHLRGRLQMHNSRIQHVMKPFEIDLVNNIHGDLVRRLTGLHTDVLGITRSLNALIDKCFPEVARAIEQQYEQERHSLTIPDALLDRFNATFERFRIEKEDQQITIQELTDCFLIHLERSTVLFQPRPYDASRAPPVSQYLELLKCQYIMQRIKAYTELQNMPRLSHWPGYVEALEERLSVQCSRFNTELEIPDTSHCGDDVLLFRFGPEAISHAPPPVSAVQYDLILEALLVPASTESTWRRMQLFKKSGSDDFFRIVDTCGNKDSLPPESGATDFNIRATVLIPIYADPVEMNEVSPPLEIILEHSQTSYSYIFLHKRDILAFQEALTGFRVVDGYSESRAVAIFVRQGREKLLEENVTVQIWMPSPTSGQSEIDGELSDGSRSWAPRPSTVSDDFSSGSNSILSGVSGPTRSSTSRTSSFTESSITVKVGGKPASTGYGLIRSVPPHPLLVLFTRDPDSPKRSIVSIRIYDETRPNPERCDCQKYSDCLITALEQSRGRLHAQRLENRPKWDLLPLAAAPDWNGLLRVSILFPSMEERYKFSGARCTCKIVTEGDVDACIANAHQGLLGMVRVYHRRLMIMWRDRKKSQVVVDPTGWQGLSLP